MMNAKATYLQRYEPSQRKLAFQYLPEARCDAASADEYRPTEVDVPPSFPSEPVPLAAPYIAANVFTAGCYSLEFTATMMQSALQYQHVFAGLSHINEFSGDPLTAPFPPSYSSPLAAESTADAPRRSSNEATSDPVQLPRDVAQSCEAVLGRLIPTRAQMTFRSEKVAELCMLLHHALRSFGVHSEIDFFFFGSVHLRTVLPDGDNDVTIVINERPPSGDATLQSLVHADYLPRLRDFLNANFPDYVFVANLIFAEVRLLKLVYRGMNIDVTIGQKGGSCTAQFLHEVDARIGERHLFKRTLLLLKAWCNYEARILGAQGGYLGTYALTVMLIAVVNDMSLRRIRTQRPSPVEIFVRFLRYYSDFDFDKNCVTIFGSVPQFGCSAYVEPETDRAITERALQRIVAQCMFGAAPSAAERVGTPTPEIDAMSQTSVSNASTPRTGTPVPHGAGSSERMQSPVLGPNFPLRHMNVLDPLRPGTNLCRGICRSHMLRIQNAFKEGQRRIARRCRDVEAGRCTPEQAASALFENTEVALQHSAHHYPQEAAPANAIAPCPQCSAGSPFCVNGSKTATPLLSFVEIGAQGPSAPLHAAPRGPKTPPSTLAASSSLLQRPTPSAKPPFVSHTQNRGGGGGKRDAKKMSRGGYGTRVAPEPRELPLDNQHLFPMLPSEAPERI